MTIAIPIAFFCICGFLVLLPFYVEPLTIGMAVLITAMGIPVYLFGIMWKSKPKIFHQFMGKYSYFLRYDTYFSIEFEKMCACILKKKLIWYFVKLHKVCGGWCWRCRRSQGKVTAEKR